ncbi:Histone-binding protein rbbp4 [Rhizopus azygosporus]|uniref:Histone-binding protein rbbp4 n=1 Tax=Rhizopus azygosporus TaxID=86630 RepID=A0A367KAK1_RHIAZ|nr:Histone-binding protein rbbp4 [Rhizopus azygosporus]
MGMNKRVIQLLWSPHHETILGTVRNDRRVCVWRDLSNIEHGDELLFVHSGHTNELSDFGWNPAEPWMIVSCGENNVLQTW